MSGGPTAGPAGATICQVLHSLNVGGAEVLAARLARKLRGSHRFLFVCLDGLGPLGEQLRAEGFPVRVLGRRPGVDWRCIRDGWPACCAASGSTWCMPTSTRRSSTGSRPDCSADGPRSCSRSTAAGIPDYPRRKRMLANRLLLERRDRVVGVGESVRQALIRNEGIPARRVGVVYNGVDLASSRTGRPTGRPSGRELGLGAEDLRS